MKPHFCLTRLWHVAFYLSLTFLLAAYTASVQANQLQSMGYSTLPGNRVQITLMFAQPVPSPQSFSTDNPARIVLDFPNTQMRLNRRAQKVGVGAVNSMSAVETRQRTRVVLNLLRVAPYEIQSVGNKIYVLIDNVGIQNTHIQRNPLAATNLAPASHTRGQPIASVTPISIPAGKRIENIDFRRQEGGSGWILVNLSDENILVDLNKRTKSIEVIFKNAALPNKLNRRLDVRDFATPVISIDTNARAGHTIMQISIDGDVEYFADRMGKLYIIKITPKAPEEEVDDIRSRLEKPVYTGNKVNFQFQDITVETALQLLLEESGEGYNLVISGAGIKDKRMNLQLKNVPWDQAFDIIMEAHGLAKRQYGNVLMIDTKEAVNSREQKELEALNKIKELEPIRTDYIQINYGTAAEFVSLLKSRGSNEEGARSFISKRGSISHDERTNTLIIQDTDTKIAEIRRLITSLDIPVRQVLIDSKVVIAEDNFSRSLGTKFGYSANTDLGNGYGVVVGGKVDGDVEYSGETAFNTDDAENYIVSLPASTLESSSPAAIGLAIGKIGNYLLQLELSAMQVEQRGEIISSPRVVTANQREATILQGRQLIVAGTAGVGATAAPTFKDVVLELKVTPQITPDDRIIMDINVKKDDLVGTSDALSRREVKTQVLVDNGETVVLGGVYERTHRKTLSRVPFISRIPLVGELFKNRENRDEKSELLIFVTPKIIKETS